MGRKLLVAAVSARPYVALAVAAGYEVVAFDIFADVDTLAMAQQVLRLPYQHGAFEPQAFADALDAVVMQSSVNQTIVNKPSTATPMLGMVYGSGFEHKPELLQLAEQRLGLIGNSLDSVRLAKDALVFFDLLRQHNILHPETRTQAPDQAQGWLRKHMGGSGGTQVYREPYPEWQAAAAGAQQGVFEPGVVYQREMAGTPVSLLFLAHGHTAKVIGYNQQFCHAGQGMPFRYGGVVSHAALPADAKLSLHSAAQQLTQALALKGLNSLDAILAEDGKVYVLELNPRLTASANLYETDIPLMELHVQACSGGELAAFEVKQHAHALAVCYAPCDMVINTLDWPEWVADIPPLGSVIAQDQPCCTVSAAADYAEQAWTLAQSRMASLFRQ